MLSTELVAGMYREYQAGASLSGLGRKYGRNRMTVRDIFHRRGLAVRSCPGGPNIDPVTGKFIAAKPATARQLEAMIADAKRVGVPRALAHEWRLWPIARRMDFIRRLRVRFPSTRPAGPFSANVEPFDYGSPRARAIVARLNRGLDSRTKRAQLKPNSEGVIWKDRLWYWVGPTRIERGLGDGYFLGVWRPGVGRPCLHHTIWEQRHGPVPPGQTVIFKDGNKNNLSPANLALRSMADCARMNQVWRRLRLDPSNKGLQRLADKIRAATIKARRSRNIRRASLLFNNEANPNASHKLIRQMV